MKDATVVDLIILSVLTAGYLHLWNKRSERKRQERYEKQRREELFTKDTNL